MTYTPNILLLLFSFRILFKADFCGYIWHPFLDRQRAFIIVARLTLALAKLSCQTISYITSHKLYSKNHVSKSNLNFWTFCIFTKQKLFVLSYNGGFNALASHSNLCVLLNLLPTYTRKNNKLWHTGSYTGHYELMTMSPLCRFNHDRQTDKRMNRQTTGQTGTGDVSSSVFHIDHSCQCT